MTVFTDDPVQTVVRFFRALDDRDNATLAGLLAEDGVWVRQGASLRNRAEIDAAMAARSPTLRIAHLLTNLFAEAAGADAAAVTAYMLVVRHDGGAGSSGPAPLSGIENIRTTRARLRRTGGGWRIVHLEGEAPLFAAAA